MTQTASVSVNIGLNRLQECGPLSGPGSAQLVAAARKAPSPTRGTHEQVKASRATVDKGPAELPEYLSAAGIDTQYSCQGGDPDTNGKTKRASITFATVDDALAFTERVALAGCHDTGPGPGGEVPCLSGVGSPVLVSGDLPTLLSCDAGAGSSSRADCPFWMR
jgi:hypothetical protein